MNTAQFIDLGLYVSEPTYTPTLFDSVNKSDDTASNYRKINEQLVVKYVERSWASLK